MSTNSNNRVANAVVVNNTNNENLVNNNSVVATQKAEKEIKNATAVVADEEIDIEKEFLDSTPSILNSGEAASEDLEALNLDDDLSGEPAGSIDFTLECDKPNVKQAYDNAGAYAMLMSIMNRNSNINGEFKLDKDNFHYAWIESRGVAGFKFYLKNESFNGIFRYLKEGTVTDFDPAPQDYDKAKFTDEFYTMKLFVDKGFVLQITPLFRERSGYITAFLPCKKGKITFRIKRTDAIVDYLREAGQFI